MTEETPKPDPDLTPEQAAKVAELSEAELKKIDEVLLANARPQWRKVAMIVGMTMSHLPNRIPGIPDVFYAQRVRKLVEYGALESQGNLQYMRFSEVRIPKKGRRVKLNKPLNSDCQKLRRFALHLLTTG